MALARYGASLNRFLYRRSRQLCATSTRSVLEILHVRELSHLGSETRRARGRRQCHCAFRRWSSMALPSGCSHQCPCRPGRDGHHPRVARASGQRPLLLARQESTQARGVTVTAMQEPCLRYLRRTFWHLARASDFNSAQPRVHSALAQVLLLPRGDVARSAGSGTHGSGPPGLGDHISIPCGAGAIITPGDRPKESTCGWTLTTD